MAKFKISFNDIWDVDIDATSKQGRLNQFYDIFLDYLNDVVNNEDLTAFEIEEVKCTKEPSKS